MSACFGLLVFSTNSLLFCRIRIDKLNQEYLVYFVGTSMGQIYKIVQFIRYGTRYSNLLDILDVASNEPIREMGLSQRTRSLYIGTDHAVKQIDLAMCARRYDSCFRCVADPYCGWDQDAGLCKPYQLGLLQVSILFFYYYFRKEIECFRLNFVVFIYTLFTTHRSIKNKTCYK